MPPPKRFSGGPRPMCWTRMAETSFRRLPRATPRGPRSIPARGRPCSRRAYRADRVKAAGVRLPLESPSGTSPPASVVHGLRARITDRVVASNSASRCHTRAESQDRGRECEPAQDESRHALGTSCGHRAMPGWDGPPSSGGHAGTPRPLGATTVIHRNAKIQHRIIEDILVVSRIITGQCVFDLQPLASPSHSAERRRARRRHGKAVECTWIRRPRAVTRKPRLQQGIWHCWRTP